MTKVHEGFEIGDGIGNRSDCRSPDHHGAARGDERFRARIEFEAVDASENGPCKALQQPRVLACDQPGHETTHFSGAFVTLDVGQRQSQSRGHKRQVPRAGTLQSVGDVPGGCAIVSRRRNGNCKGAPRFGTNAKVWLIGDGLDRPARGPYRRGNQSFGHEYPRAKRRDTRSLCPAIRSCTIERHQRFVQPSHPIQAPAQRGGRLDAHAGGVGGCGCSSQDGFRLNQSSIFHP